MKHFNVIGLSIALIDDGNLSVVEGFGLTEVGGTNSVNLNTILNACSISKFATAMLALELVGRGTLELDQDVNDKLISWNVPENIHTQSKKVTLRNLLSHHSGFIDTEGSYSEYNSADGIPTMVDILIGKTSFSPEPLKVKNEPGSVFQYSDSGYCIIQQLMEDASGKPFKALMREMIFEPLLMKNSTLEHTIPDRDCSCFACGHNKEGILVEGKYPIYPYPAAAGLWSTPTDLAYLAIEMIHSLNGCGKLGISQILINEMITPQDGSPWAGLGVFLDHSDRKLEVTSLGWGIGFQSMLIVHPHIGKGAIVMTNTDLGVHQSKGLIGELINSLS
ncbi:serine hydrolase domain-containing protein [Paenibacillus wynnii]|uniref:serine hydrolase domain-containing protein n=1 Tax=Paenibacillus wynnii TaxID=268407 RepID=UPI0027D92A31|nr:serine hydrolase domain-containing protein [Paenibacillus wynnii]